MERSSVRHNSGSETPFAIHILAALSVDSRQFNTCPRKQKHSFMNVSLVRWNSSLSFYSAFHLSFCLFPVRRNSWNWFPVCFLYEQRKRRSVSAPSTQSHNGETSESICLGKTYKNKSTHALLDTLNKHSTFFIRNFSLKIWQVITSSHTKPIYKVWKK